MSKETKVSRLLPRLRFPEFKTADAWTPTPLGSVLSLEYGTSLPEKDRSGSGFPVIGSNGLVGYHASATVQGPAIVVGRKGSVGAINFIASDCTPIDTTFYVKIKQPEDHDFRFIWRLLEAARLDQNGDAGAVPGLNRNDVYRRTFGVPDPAEQHKIAECLGSLDDWIAAETDALAALRRHKTGLMQQLFPRTGETRPPLRFPEFQDADGWEDTTLEHTCDMKAGDFVAASEIADTRGADMYPCYGGNGLRGYVTTSTHSGRFVLIGRQGALCGNVNLFDDVFHATEHALVATPKRHVFVDWLFYALASLDLNRFATGQAQPGLSVSVLNTVQINVPHDESEQHRIAGCLASLDDRIASQEVKLAGLRDHKKGLMQQLFPAPDDRVGGVP